MSEVHKTRLEAVRRQMAKMGVDVMIVRSTDRYLNEYVPTDESARVWVSGFTGSMGEVLLTEAQAFLAADGRYWLQAEKETDPAAWTVLKVQLGTGLDAALKAQLTRLIEAAKPKKLRVGYEPDRLTPNQLDNLRAGLEDAAVWKPLFPSPVEQARGAARPPPRESKMRAIDEKRIGATVGDKLALLATRLAELNLDGFLVQRLDDIAYLSNLRGEELPYQATFKAVALATPETLFIGIDPSRVPNLVRVTRDRILFVPESEFWTLMGKKSKRQRVGYDLDNNTVQAVERLKETGATLIPVPTPLGPMKAKKTPAELRVMQEAFIRADRVIDKAVKWVTDAVVEGQPITEADFAQKVTQFFTEAGATGLSFKVISAAGQNGAIIHYSDPDPQRVLKKGELMLLDTGAYFSDGYATDLTRTFLLDTAEARGTAEQIRYYTLVLKAAIAGMSAVIPDKCNGVQLDALVRAPLWAQGLDYNHGTGHGVGINVHEFPPRISKASGSPLEEGFVFSIEPGLYLSEFGGVRIENLCTLVPALPGFLRVQPLTYSPLDERLIDPDALNSAEKAFLAQFKANYSATGPIELPPALAEPEANGAKTVKKTEKVEKAVVEDKKVKKSKGRARAE